MKFLYPAFLWANASEGRRKGARLGGPLLNLAEVVVQRLDSVDTGVVDLAVMNLTDRGDGHPTGISDRLVVRGPNFGKSGPDVLKE